MAAVTMSNFQFALAVRPRDSLHALIVSAQHTERQILKHERQVILDFRRQLPGASMVS